MKILNLSVWIIDNVQPNNNDPFIDELTDKLYLLALPSSLSINPVGIAKQTLIDIDSKWENILGNVPTVLFMDDDTNIIVSQVNKPTTVAQIVNEAERVSNFTYNETIGEYLNQFGFPVPRVLFRDPGTGIIEIFQNTLMASLPPQLFLLKGIAFGLGAAFSKGTIKKGACALVAVACLNEYRKRKI